MVIKKKILGTTHDYAIYLNCDWTNHNDVYSSNADKAAKDHVRFHRGHKVMRET